MNSFFKYKIFIIDILSAVIIDILVKLSKLGKSFIGFSHFMCFFFFLIEFPRPFAASSNSLANFKDIPFPERFNHQRTAMFVDLNLLRLELGM
jgi:hypothetical protein